MKWQENEQATKSMVNVCSIHFVPILCQSLFLFWAFFVCQFCSTSENFLFGEIMIRPSIRSPGGWALYSPEDKRQAFYRARQSHTCQFSCLGHLVYADWSDLEQPKKISRHIRNYNLWFEVTVSYVAVLLVKALHQNGTATHSVNWDSNIRGSIDTRWIIYVLTSDPFSESLPSGVSSAPNKMHIQLGTFCSIPLGDTRQRFLIRHFTVPSWALFIWSDSPKIWCQAQGRI